MSELIRYDAMCAAIDAAYEVDEVKDIHDKALAIEVYTRQAHNVEAERRACEIRLRAERKVGLLLKAQEMAKGAPGNQHTGKVDRSSDTTGPRTLADLGISKDQSSKWQQLADVPDEQFEAALAAPDKPTTTGIIASAKPAPAAKSTEPDANEIGHAYDRLNRYLATTKSVPKHSSPSVLKAMSLARRKSLRSRTARLLDWAAKLLSLLDETEATDADADRT